MKQFWNKAESSNDIYIYGDIVSKSWDATDVTAQSFMADLKLCKGGVKLHVNSGGGDVFTALAIYNILKEYEGEVEVYVDGLAASAASLIICAGDVVKVARNALIMVHKPTVGLMGYYDDETLTKVQNSLKAVEGAILETYKSRLAETRHEEIAEMVMAETWMTAEEAVDIGLADEVSGEVDIKVDSELGLLIVNQQEFDCRELGNKIKKVIKRQGVKEMEKQTVKDAIKEVRQQELSRIKTLTSLKTGAAEIDALIEVGIVEGASVEEVQKYIDAVKGVVKKEEGYKELKAEVIDNLTSGAQGVGAAPVADKMTELSAAIAKYANEMIGVKKNG